MDILMTAIYFNFTRTGRAGAYSKFYLIFTPFHMTARSALFPIVPVGIFLFLPLYFFFLFCTAKASTAQSPHFSQIPTHNTFNS